MVVGTVADLLEPAASCRSPFDSRAPPPCPDTLFWMYSARRWSARSTSANDGPACTEDLDDGAHGPCRCASRSTADVPFRCRGAITETAKNSSQQ
jgi:hypothetical protein